MANKSIKSAFEQFWTHVVAKCGDILESAKTYADGEITTVASNLNSHINNKSNPHSITKTQIGLGNVDNTSDANKPVSTAQQAAIDNMETTLTAKINGCLPLSAGESYPLTGPLGLTNNVGYGESLPDGGFEGQLFFVEEESADLLHRKVVSTTLNYNSWSSSIPYTQTITVAGISSDSLPHITLNYDSTLSTAKDQRTNFGYVSDATSGAGTITFKCFDSKPAINLPIIIEFFY